MRIYYKTYYYCDEDLANVIGNFGREVNILTESFTFNGVLEDDGSYSVEPAWFVTETSALYPLSDCGWVFNTPAETDTHYRFSWTATYHTGEEVEYIVELIMGECATVINDNPCVGSSGDITTLVWLNREGGWSYLHFYGKTTFETRIPDGELYQKTDYVKRNNQRRNVHRGEILSTGSLSEDLIPILESLKESVQVYKVENFGEVGQKQIPVILEDGDFVRRKTGDKIFDFKVKFYYAEEKIIQSQ